MPQQLGAAVVPAPGPVHATVRSPGAGVAAGGRARPPPSSRRRSSPASRPARTDPVLLRVDLDPIRPARVDHGPSRPGTLSWEPQQGR